MSIHVKEGLIILLEDYKLKLLGMQLDEKGGFYKDAYDSRIKKVSKVINALKKEISKSGTN